MTSEQKDLVRSSFACLAPKADLVAARFYFLLFEMNPALRPMFQVSLKFQKVKFMDMLGSALESLDNLDHLVTVVWQLGKRHAGYGVKDEHYAVVREALLQSLEEELGEQYTGETGDAWRELYDLMALAMRQAAAEGAVPRP